MAKSKGDLGEAFGLFCLPTFVLCPSGFLRTHSSTIKLTMANNFTLKCKCGSFEANFTGLPRITFNCQCHSCVAVVNAIESKDNFDGTSIKCDVPAEGDNKGAAVAIYKSNNVTIAKVDETKINFMKVGEEGKFGRPYCTECGTILFNAWQPNWCAVNRNALVNTSSGEPFKPVGDVMNVNCKSSFDDSAIPKPKHGSVPFGMLLKFIPMIAGLAGDGSNAKEKALIPEDISKVEFTPITWE